MKKLNCLFLSGIMALSMLSFSSCSDDDDDINKPTNESELVGTWALSFGGIYGQIDVKANPEALNAPVSKYASEMLGNLEAVELTLEADKRFVWAGPAEKEGEGEEGKTTPIMIGKYELVGDDLVLTPDGTMSPYEEGKPGVDPKPIAKDAIILYDVMKVNSSFTAKLDMTESVEYLSTFPNFLNDLKEYGLNEDVKEFKIESARMNVTFQK